MSPLACMQILFELGAPSMVQKLLKALAPLVPYSQEVRGLVKGLAHSLILQQRHDGQERLKVMKGNVACVETPETAQVSALIQMSTPSSAIVRAPSSSARAPGSSPTGGPASSSSAWTLGPCSSARTMAGRKVLNVKSV